ncbi:MAG: glycosyltransferase family 39 protein, partial [Planctomycetes bacterium]|nr:glycosyltransferase family 39 protein [Planctomycetota bacterium]
MVTALAAVTWLMSTFFVRLDEPWDQSLGGTTSGAYYGLAARAFEVHGLGNLRLQPLHFYQPNTTKTVFAYRNHPPFPHLITATAYRLLGHDERSLRLPIFLLTCLTVLGTFMAARRRPGHEVAWIALCLLAATPMFFQYGDMVDAPSFSLVTLVWAWLAWERHRRLRSGRSLTLWLIAGGLAGLSDWFGYLLVPVLWLDLLIRRRDERPWRLAFIAGLPFGLALVAFCLWLIWTAGWQGALDQLLNLSRVPSRNDTT